MAVDLLPQSTDENTPQQKEGRQCIGPTANCRDSVGSSIPTDFGFLTSIVANTAKRTAIAIFKRHAIQSAGAIRPISGAGLAIWF
jgi:hypothetical protein